MSAPDPADRCLPGEELTAFAHGEHDDGAAALVSRHLLRCPVCRAEADAAAAMFARLGRLGAGGAPALDAFDSDLRAADARRRGRRLRGRVLAASVAAAVLLVVGLGPAGGPRVGPAATAEAGVCSSVPFAALPMDEWYLVDAQQIDGRWGAGADAPAVRDEAVTGLAILALASRHVTEIERDTVGDAIRAGSEWLLARQGPDGRFGEGPAFGDAFGAHALATSALLEVYARRPARPLRAAIDRAVRWIEVAGPGAASGDRDLRIALTVLDRAAALRSAEVASPGSREARTAFAHALERHGPSTPGAASGGPWLLARSSAPRTDARIDSRDPRAEPTGSSLTLALRVLGSHEG